MARIFKEYLKKAQLNWIDPPAIVFCPTFQHGSNMGYSKYA